MDNTNLWRVPPGNTKWALDWQDPISHDLVGSYDVPDQEAAAITELVVRITGVANPDDLMAGPLDVNGETAVLLQTLVSVDVEVGRYDYSLAIFQP